MFESSTFLNLLAGVKNRITQYLEVKTVVGRSDVYIITFRVKFEYRIIGGYICAYYFRNIDYMFFMTYQKDK